MYAPRSRTSSPGTGSRRRRSRRTVGRTHSRTVAELDSGMESVRPPDRAPVRPSKIICVGRNYVDHAKELGNEVPKAPLLFLKPSSAMIGPGEAIMLPKASAQVEYEAEIGVIIATTLRH